MVHTNNDHSPFLLPCPLCQRPTASLKAYYTPLVVYLILLVWWRKRTTVACPQCMQPRVFSWSALSLIGMHVAWPFFALPLTIAYWIDLKGPGHSRSILEQASSGAYGPDIAARAADLLRGPASPNSVKTLVIGSVKIALGSVVFLVCMFLTQIQLAGGVLAAKADQYFYLGGSILCGLAGILIWSGVRNVRLKSASWLGMGAALLVGGGVFLGGTSLLWNAIWSYQERLAREQLTKQASGSGSALIDYCDLPWQVTTPEGINQLIDVAGRRNQLNEVRFFMERIETRRSSDPEFQALVNDYHAKLDHRKREQWAAAESEAIALLPETILRYESLPWEAVSPRGLKMFVEQAAAIGQLQSIEPWMSLIEEKLGDNPEFVEVLDAYRRALADERDQAQ